MDTPERLLLIDDDETFARVLARALTARGFSVAVAHDAAGALTLLRREHPAYAVLDLKLGADNGLALIPQLLAIAPQLRILLLTGYASIATAVEAIKRGAHDYLAKPVDADAVVRRILESTAADDAVVGRTDVEGATPRLGLAGSNLVEGADRDEGRRQGPVERDTD